MSSTKESTSSSNNKEINEKKLNNDSAPFELSNTLHATFGMDHYPNYLFRWNMNDLTALENQITSQLKQIQQTKQKMSQILKISESFKGSLNIRHLNCNQRITLITKMLHPKLAPFIEYNKEKKNISFKWDWNMISELLAEETTNVYSFPLFDCAFCDNLLKHTESYLKFMQSVNAMNNESDFILSARRSVLDFMNLSWLNDFLLKEVINPITKCLYQRELFFNCSSSEKAKDKFIENTRLLDWRHGYIIGYKAESELFDDIYDDDVRIYQRSGLIKHSDDSEITLNCCLSDEFEGGELNIFNIRGGKKKNGNGLEVEISLKKGYAIIHRGRQLHSVNDVISGKRAVLVVWCRSVNGLRREVCPCCWLNRRDDLNCICGKMWN